MRWIRIFQSSFLLFLVTINLFALDLNYFPTNDNSINFYSFQHFNSNSEIKAKITSSDVTFNVDMQSKISRDEALIEYYSRFNSLNFWGIKTGYIFNETTIIEPELEGIPLASIDLYRTGVLMPEFIWWKELPGSKGEFEQMKYRVMIMPSINVYSIDEKNSSSLFGENSIHLDYSSGEFNGSTEKKFNVELGYIHSEIRKNTLLEENTNFGSYFSFIIKQQWQFRVLKKSLMGAGLSLSYFTEQKNMTEGSYDTLFSEEFTIKPYHKLATDLYFESSISHTLSYKIYVDYALPYQRLYKTSEYSSFKIETFSETMIGFNLTTQY
ncbi:hypothetical protein N9N67_10910 [Bacteriovoracaceae bacterium]|nr:hypothetical protein [Bacteriovoracaceae bacterium]